MISPCRDLQPPSPAHTLRTELCSLHGMECCSGGVGGGGGKMWAANFVVWMTQLIQPVGCRESRQTGAEVVPQHNRAVLLRHGQTASLSRILSTPPCEWVLLATAFSHPCTCSIADRITISPWVGVPRGHGRLPSWLFRHLSQSRQWALESPN